MPAGDATIAELDKLTASLLGGGKNAEHFQAAIKSAGASLDVAKASTLAANVALDAGALEYASLETAALQASKAVEKLAARGGGMSREYLEAAKKASEANTAVGAYAGTLKTLENNAAAAAAKETQLATTFKNVQKLSNHANAAITAKAETIEKLRGGLASVPGAAGRMGSALLAPVQGFAKLSATMGTARAAALLTATATAALVIGFAALAVGVIAATAAVAAWAVGLADARRSAGLANEAFAAMNPTLAALPFGEITAETGQSAKALQGLAKQLQAAKVKAEDMPAALRAAALAETALGQGGASDFIAQLKDSKRAVSELASETSTKLGGVVARQMIGLDAQSARLKSNISALFGGLNIDPVLAGMQRLVALFDKNTAAGQAIQFLFEKVFQPLIDQADKAAIVLEAFALGFLIGMTKLYIAIKPTIKAIGEFFGFEDTSLTDVLNLAKKAGEIVAVVFAALAVIVGVTLAAAFVVVGALVAAQVAVWYAVITVVQVAWSVFKAFGSFLLGFGELLILPFKLAWKAIQDLFAGASLVDVGRNLMLGLVQGITNAVSAVVGAVKNAVGAAIGAAKSVLGIASPSKVFAGIGEDTGAGFVAGVDDTAADAQAAMTAMVEPPDAQTVGLGGVAASVASPADAARSSSAEGADAANGGASAGAMAGANFAGAIFNFTVADGTDAADRFVERITALLEGDAAQLGGEVAA